MFQGKISFENLELVLVGQWYQVEIQFLSIETLAANKTCPYYFSSTVAAAAGNSNIEVLPPKPA